MRACRAPDDGNYEYRYPILELQVTCPIPLDAQQFWGSFGAGRFGGTIPLATMRTTPL